MEVICMGGQRLALFLASMVCSPALAETAASCTPSSEAPEILPLLTAPAGSKVIAQIPRDTASLSKVDGESLGAGNDWLKVRSGDVVGWLNGKFAACRFSPEQAREVIGATADRVLRALAARDMKSLGAMAHPIKGIQFSPHASVDKKSGQVLTPARIKAALSDPVRRVWGYDDGSGKPIRLTFAQYYRAFVYDRDFGRATERRYNSFSEETTTLNTIEESYPSAITVEYHIPGGTSGDGKWASLILVFEQQAGAWYLSAIIHDAWTI
jgi:hypothetical protein